MKSPEVVSLKILIAKEILSNNKFKKIRTMRKFLFFKQNRKSK